jgi:hypothetical protein
MPLASASGLALPNARRGAPSARDRVRCRRRDGIEHNIADAPPAPCPIHHVKQPSFFGPGSFCVRVLLPSFRPRRCRSPSEGDWRSAQRRPALYVSRSNARRHACEALALPRNREARLTALRRGVVGPGPASVPGICRVRREGSTPPAAKGWLRCRAFRVRGYQPRSTPHPAPPSGSPRESAPHERDVRYIAYVRLVVKIVAIKYL